MDKNFKDYIFIDKIKYVRAKKSESDGTPCIFCNLKEQILDANEQSYCILNKYPYNPGHLLIIPKRHVENFEDLTDKEHLACFELIKKMLALLRKTYSPHGFNIGLNLGEAAGASIRHLHIHLVPRYKSELGFMDVLSSTRTIVEPLKDTFVRLKKNLKQ
ncbi:MAG: HIT family protein [Candidatus Helarchaeota archaeon]